MTGPSGKLSDNVAIDDELEIVTVYGTKVSAELFRNLGSVTRAGWWLRVINVTDGVATVEQAPGFQIAKDYPLPRINAAQIIAWARGVRDDVARAQSTRWTATEIAIASVILAVTAPAPDA